jgi:hypothetical protein
MSPFSCFHRKPARGRGAVCAQCGEPWCHSVARNTPASVTLPRASFWAMLIAESLRLDSRDYNKDSQTVWPFDFRAFETRCAYASPSATVSLRSSILAGDACIRSVARSGWLA